MRRPPGRSGCQVGEPLLARVWVHYCGQSAGESSPVPCEALLESHALRDKYRLLAFESLLYAVAPAIGDGLGH